MPQKPALAADKPESFKSATYASTARIAHTVNRQHSPYISWIAQPTAQVGPRKLRQLVGFLDKFSRLPRPGTVNIIAVARTKRCTSSRTMHPTDTPSAHRWCLAPCLRGLGPGRASGRVMGALHGVGVHFSISPPLVTGPTIACPPEWTWTCSTVIFCCPPLRCFLRASVWAVNVRASLLNVRS